MIVYNHIIQMSKNIDPHILKLFKIGQLMGSGAYGHVWKVQSREDGKKYALKKVFGAFRNSVDAQRTYRQVEVLKQLHHQNIIRLERVMGSVNKEDLYLLFQLMEADLLAVVGSNILSLSHQKFILFQIISAISHIHSLHLIHRDLKPSNVLLDSHCLVKICDFGLVRKLDWEEADNQILSEEVATKWYRAPQLLLGSRSYSFPVDLWSIGCIAAQLLTGKTLFSGSSTLQQLEKIIQFSGLVSQQDLQSLDSPVAECLISQIHPKTRQFSDYFSLVDPVFFPLIKGLLQFNPAKRLTAKQCLQLDIFKQLREENSQAILERSVHLILDDNYRFQTKDYRNQIYSSIAKDAALKNMPKSLTKYKSLTRVENKNGLQKPAHSIINKHKSASLSANLRLRTLNAPDKKRQSPKKRPSKLRSASPILGQLSKGRYQSPYEKSAKHLSSILKNSSCYLMNQSKSGVSKLKKIPRIMKQCKTGKK